MDSIIASVDRYLSTQQVRELEAYALTYLNKSKDELTPQELSLVLIEMKNKHPEITVGHYLRLCAGLQATTRNDKLCAEIAKLSTLIDQHLPIPAELPESHVDMSTEKVSAEDTTVQPVRGPVAEPTQLSSVYTEWVAQNLDKVKEMYPGEWAAGDETRYVCEYLAYKGLLDIIKEAPETKNLEMFAVQRGQLNVIKWAVESGRPFEKHGVFIIASYWGYLHILEYMYDKFPNCPFVEHLDYRAVKFASSQGRLDVVKWFSSIGRLSSHQARQICAETAADNGHLDIVKHLLDVHSFHGGGVVIEKAASSGHLKLVQFLCTHTAVDAKSAIAAAKNQQHVLEWLNDVYE